MLATGQWIPTGRSTRWGDEAMEQDAEEQADYELGGNGLTVGDGSDDGEIDFTFEDCFKILEQPPDPESDDGQISGSDQMIDAPWTSQPNIVVNPSMESLQLREHADAAHRPLEQMNITFLGGSSQHNAATLEELFTIHNGEATNHRKSNAGVSPIEPSSPHKHDPSLSKQPQEQPDQVTGLTFPNIYEMDFMLHARSSEAEDTANHQNHHPGLNLCHARTFFRSLGVYDGEPFAGNFPVIDEDLEVAEIPGPGRSRNSGEVNGNVGLASERKWGGLYSASGVSSAVRHGELESAGASMYLEAGSQGHLSAQSNVVDLTEDSDDESPVCVLPQDRVTLPLKRKAEHHMGPQERRINMLREVTAKSARKDSNNHIIGPVNSLFGHRMEGLSSKPTAWGKARSQGAQLWTPNSLGSSHIPYRDSSIFASTQNATTLSEFKRATQMSSGGSENLANVSSTGILRRAQDDTASQISSKSSEFPASAPNKMVTGATASQRPLSGVCLMEADVDPLQLSVTLLRHQRMALWWMKKRELEGVPPGGILADDQGLGKTVSTISLIVTLRPPAQKKEYPEAISVPHRESLTVDLGDDDDTCQGVQVVASREISVQSSHTPASSNDNKAASASRPVPTDAKTGVNKPRTPAGTLIVCPTSVLRQWAHELKEKVTEVAKLSVLIYHGSNRAKNPDELAKYDVVLTTYAIVSMEVPKQVLPEEEGDKKLTRGGDHEPVLPRFTAQKKPTENVKKNKNRGTGKGRPPDSDHGSGDGGPLTRLYWFRIVLDEAQSIKNARTQVARATWGLRAKRRWCLSGTPIQNKIDDLYSYFRFLRFSPYDSYKEFREKLKDPVTRNPACGYKELQRCLSQVMIRRTKATVINGVPIINLPPRNVLLKQAEFSEEERAFYSALEAESRQQFKDYADAGTVQSNYVNILWMLLRLRQACNHPHLVKCRKSQGSKDHSVDSAKKLPPEKRMLLLSLLEANRDICSICSDIPDEPTICTCTHIFCRQCILERLATGDDNGCPTPKCKKSLNPSLVYTLASLSNQEEQGGSSERESPAPQVKEECKIRERIPWKSSSKIDAVIDTLSALPPVQAVVVNGKVVEQISKDKASCNNGEELQLRSKPSPLMSAEEESLNNYPRKGICSTSDTNSSGLCGKAERRELIDSPVICGEDVVTGCQSSADQEKNVEDALGDGAGLSQIPRREIVLSTEKAIVFSQWTSMLDLLEVKLKKANFNYRRLDGTMSVLARDRAALEFKTLPEVTVIIMSLKAASLGLNMVAACHVLLLDPWWNPTAEDQAIDRAHRIGQTRTVTVSRFTVKDTVEDRILALQEKKRKLVTSAFGEEGGDSNKAGLSAKDFHYLFDV